MSEKTVFSRGSFFHGTRADLKVGDLIVTGKKKNYHDDRKSAYVYFAGTLDAAIWGAELAEGEGRERIYVVEPTGDFEDDPNVTDKKFPGNPTKSYRSKHWTDFAASPVHRYFFTSFHSAGMHAILSRNCRSKIRLI